MLASGRAASDCIHQLSQRYCAGAGSAFLMLAKRRSTDKGVSINNQPIASGAGVRQMKNKTVDFGASDADRTHGCGAVQGIAPKQLRLSGSVVADIYWKDWVSAAVEIPDGFGGKGNEAVQPFTGQTNGPIGYLEYCVLRNQPRFVTSSSASCPRSSSAS